jgi:hypothetical protein
MNEETCRVKGFSREELLKLTVMELPAHLSTKIWMLSNCGKYSTGKSITFEAKTQRKDGHYMTVKYISQR